MASPLQIIKNRFGSKEALVDKVMPLLDRNADETDAGFRDRLLRVSNNKLLRLLEQEETVRRDFGTRAVLADKLTLLSTGGLMDADLRARLGKQSTGRLLGRYSVLARKSK